MPTLVSTIRRFTGPALSLVTALCFLSCSRQNAVDPNTQEVAPAHYTLTDVRYFMTAADRLDTLTVMLDSTEVRNAGTTVATQKISGWRNPLTKTSRFTVDQLQTLPQNVTLEQIEVRVPEVWHADGSYGFFRESFTLSATEQKKPYDAYENDGLDVRIPTKSSIIVRRTIDAHHLLCSFSAVLINESTGQRYPITGKWNGIARYNNLSVSLTEHALGDR